MALDWSKEISFSGLRKSRTRTKVEYPTKRYIDLSIRKKTTVDVRRTVPLVVLLVLVVVLFCKFGVFDFYDRVNQKQAELTTQTQLLNSLQAQLTDYEAVKAEFETYESSKLVADDQTVSALDALSLVDRYITPAAHVQTVDLQGNTMSLNLTNISLDGVGKLVKTLYEQPIVANVSVSTASDSSEASNASTTAAMVITLQRA